MSIYLHLVTDALERWRDRIAFHADARELTYSQTAELIGCTMSGLRARGVRAGDCVAVLAPNSPEAWITCTAVQFLGACSLGLHARSSAADHAFECADAGVRLLAVDARFSDAASKVEGTVVDMAELVAGAALTLDPEVADDEDLVELLYTGGTTGRPKGVEQPHRSRAAIALSSQLAYELPVRPRYLASAPITHASGHFVVPTLMRGGTVVLMDGFNPEELVQTVNDQQVSLAFLVPSMIYKLLDAFPGEIQMPSLERVVYGASPMAPSRLIEAHERIGRVFTQIYGQTETLALGTALLSDEHDLNDAARLASCGRQVPGTIVALLGDDNRPVGPDEVGEMCVRSPGVMRGYRNQPALTAETMAGGWLHTGDMARRDLAGYLTIVDRRKDFIITGGFNVYSREIEDVIASDPTVAVVAVFGVPDPVWGESVKAVVVPAAGADVNVAALTKAVRDAKGPVHAPKSIDVVDQVPLTPVGKVDKRALRNQYWEGRERAVS